MISVFAYSTEEHASETLNGCKQVQLGSFEPGEGFLPVATRTDERPVWHQDSSLGNNGQRSAETYTDVYIPVSETLCETLQAEDGMPDLVEVTVWETVERKVGSDTVTPMTARWRISLDQASQEIAESDCCESG